ncbi:hypothetical protein [Polaromonas naphthalenivorans]|uniref:Uncharacterized protein n=1 Tax=Polaromonas naphthalenivorans (strain CJ2) TaxID=365044 RepID=A1VWI9_POLNA|nr:hypothetical protein [Polaromonas naphthalenivorans]ABM40017.1 conserved hypothetical protein [Polaromonas naphthalenivorans CJ2]
MAAYLQQGHGSWGLLEEEDIGVYKGLVLSPVNDSPDGVRNGLARLKEKRKELEVILDPQLYNPTIDKGRLNEWDYYSADFETADHSDASWWSARGREVVDNALQLGVDAVCSPALFPREFSDEYYQLIVEVADATCAYASKNNIETLLTAIICLKDLGNPARALQIASILSNTNCERIYLTFLSEDVQTREPLQDAAALPTAVHLVRLLSQHLRVHVAFCAHDLVLWKFAGATDISTGKFFNLRRFSPGRWRDDDSTGRQVAYWNEGPLVTLLRDQEVLRLDREHWFDERSFTSNPAGEQILSILRGGTGNPWQKLSWLQYLRWAYNTDKLLSDAGKAEKALEHWDGKWGEIRAKRILFTDRFNNGDHVRIWLNAVREGGVR